MAETGDNSADMHSSPDVLWNLALDAYDAGRWREATDKFREALAAGYNPVKGWTNLAAALRAAGYEAASIAAAGRAIVLDPTSAEAWAVRGNARARGQDPDLGVADLERAVALDPRESRYLLDLAVAQTLAGRAAEAVESFQKLPSQDRRSARYEFQVSQALLAVGRFEEGWAASEQRFAAGALKDRGTAAPRWDGEPTDETVLVLVEQGLGDAIQFARFLPTLLQRAPNSIIECLPPLRRLFESSFPEARFVTYCAEMPEHAAWLPFQSLPALLGAPAVEMSKPYLKAPARRSPVPLGGGSLLKVGLTWRGKEIPWDRSCPIEEILAIADIPGIALFSLQRGGAQDIKAAGAEAFITDLTPGLLDFADDARVLNDLDLIISIDTSLAHLAGSLGRPVWLLMTFKSDWRYPHGRTDNDWYPSMRVFRQRRAGDWSQPVEELRCALEERVKDTNKSTV